LKGTEEKIRGKRRAVSSLMERDFVEKGATRKKNGEGKRRKKEVYLCKKKTGSDRQEGYQASLRPERRRW